MHNERSSSSTAGRIPRPLLLILALLLCALPGCRHPDGAAEASDLAGTYALASIGGVPLPCTPPHEGGAPEVRSGAITLNADGTFTSIMTYGLRDGGEGSRNFRGTWTREGPSYQLQWEGAGTTTATLEGGIFTMVNEGLDIVYRK